MIDPMTKVLATFRRQEATSFADAWVGLEPTFQTEKSVRKWAKMAAKKGGEDAYFEDAYMLETQKAVARSIKKRYERHCSEGQPQCMFAHVKLVEDRDPWDVVRQNLVFHWADDKLEPFEVKLSLDPETFEYSIKPVPLVWLYDERFVSFLDKYIFGSAFKHGLSPSIAHGGAQFSFSAKTFLGGSLLADDIASKLNHPELSTWIMDWPNPDDRPFRATRQRFAAFKEMLAAYWAGRFHPRAIGTLTAENAYLDRGFGPAHSADADLMDSTRGPVGTPREVFQTNFAFGRAVRLLAQSIHPGYWQAAHPKEDGYRPDQIMRYGEANLNRLQIAGELHVKSGKPLDEDRSPDMKEPLEIGHLTTEASWENRAQMSRTSARDFVEAILLDVHHAQYLQAHPHVEVKESLHQDQLLGNAEETLKRFGGEATLECLHAEARKLNRESSRGRMNTDWIEPETLFWAAWKVLPVEEKAQVAREVVKGFIQRVEEAAIQDSRKESDGDAMEWHRHRLHPLLWEALVSVPQPGAENDPVARELQAWQDRKAQYSSRRPQWSQVKDSIAPWEESRSRKHMDK